MDKAADKTTKGKPEKSSAKATDKPPSAGAERVRRHRKKMKAMGLKPVTLWVPDVDRNSPEYKEEIRRECRLINADPDSEIVLEGMLELADFSDWKA